jgi:DNA-directed RNA polymerase subunit alpha
MLIAQRPSLTEDQVDEFRSRFAIEPLEPGFGYNIILNLKELVLSSEHDEPVLMYLRKQWPARAGHCRRHRAAGGH